jgi:hypothetical protein
LSADILVPRRQSGGSGPSALTSAIAGATYTRPKPKGAPTRKVPFTLWSYDAIMRFGLGVAATATSPARNCFYIDPYAIHKSNGCTVGPPNFRRWLLSRVAIDLRQFRNS